MNIIWKSGGNVHVVVIFFTNHWKIYMIVVCILPTEHLMTSNICVSAFIIINVYRVGQTIIIIDRESLYTGKLIMKYI